MFDAWLGSALAGQAFTEFTQFFHLRLASKSAAYDADLTLPSP
jgi:K+-transporting ATPase c subunit